MWFALRYLYLPAIVLCLERPRVENVGEIGQRFHFRRAVDGTRGRKYFDPATDGLYDSYGSSGGNYDPDQPGSGFSDIRSNVPGEPGVSYPTYISVPRTSFSCAGRNQGYYADEESGCQAFHVCNSVVVASFICPVGSIFSQALLICDWWNKVNCGMTNSYASFRQESYNNDSEMVQKAYTMMQPPDRSRVRSGQQTGAKRRVKIKKVRIEPNGVSDFATAGERKTQDYNNLRISEPKVQENYPFGRNNFDSNRQSEKDLVNLRLQPQEFVVNDQEQGSIPNGPVQDSSIIFIQKNNDDNSQNTYTPSGHSTFGNNFESYDRQEVNDFGNQFQPSYAPTVPTVTTTTRRLYSPTVPTPYKPSTLSYDNYDQDFEGSRHLYSSNNRDINLSTTPPITTTYKDEEFEDPQNLGSEQLNQSDRIVTDGIQDPENLPGSVQPNESTALDQNIDSNFQRNENGDVGNIEIESRSGFQLEQSALEESVGNPADDHTSVSRQTDTTMNKNKKNNDTLDSGFEITPLFSQIQRPVRPPGRPVINIADQIYTIDSFNKAPQLISRLSQPADRPNERGKYVSDGISESTRSLGTNFTNIFDQTQALQSTAGIPRSIPQTAQTKSASSAEDQSSSGIGDAGNSDVSVESAESLTSRASKSIEPPRLDSADVSDQAQIFRSSARIITVPQLPQSALSTGIQPSGETGSLASSSRVQSLSQINDESNLDISTTLPMIPLISQIIRLLRQLAQSTSSSGVEDLNGTNINNNLDAQRFVTPAGIPLLIPQSSQSIEPSDLKSPSVMNNNRIIGRPPSISALIPQIPQPTTSSESQSSAASNDEDDINIPTRIPPLIPQAAQSTSPAEINEPSGVNNNNNLVVPTIPPLIPLTSQTIRPSDLDDINGLFYLQSFETPTDIPPLIPQSSQTIAPLDMESPSVTNDDSSTSGPPETSASVPQFLQPSTTSDSQSSVANNDEDDVDIPTRIPPLIPLASQTIRPSDMDPTDELFYAIPTETPPDIPPLIPQSSQTIAPLDMASPSVTNDGSSTRGPPQTSASVPQILQPSTTSDLPSSVTSNDEDDVNIPTRIPPLIPQAAQSTSSLGAQDPSEINVDSDLDVPVTLQPMRQSNMNSIDALNNTQNFGTTSIIPPLFVQISQSDLPSRMESLNVTNNVNIIRMPPRISSLFPQSSQAPPRIPSVIPQTTQSSISSESQIPGDNNSELAPSLPARIPSLILPVLQSTPLPEIQSPVTQVSSQILPLIPQTPRPSMSSESQFSGNNNEELVPGPPTKIPPLIFPLPQSTSAAEEQSPSIVNNNNIFRPPTKIPLLISEAPQSETSSGNQSSDDTFNEPIPNTPIKIPPLIPQVPQKGSGGFDDESAFDVPALFPQIPQSIGSTQMDSTNETDRTKISGTATKIPLLIPQIPQFEAPLDMQSTDSTENGNKAPPKISPFIPQTPQLPKPSGSQFDVNFDKQPFDTPSKIPSTINQVSIPLASIGLQKETANPSSFDFNYEFQSFYPLVGSVPATVVRFRGRYQNPSPFVQFQAPVGLPGQHFVIGQTNDRAAYDSDQERGLRMNSGTQTFSSPAHSVKSTAESFRINVPDLSSAEDENPKDSFVRSASGNFNTPYTSSPKTSTHSSVFANIKNVDSLPKLNITNKFPFNFSTTNYSQAKLTERPSSASSTFSTIFNDPFFTLNRKNVLASTPTEQKVSTLAPFTVNAGDSRYSSFKQVGAPISQKSTPAKPPDFNKDSQFTIRGASGKDSVPVSPQLPSNFGNFDNFQKLFGSTTPKSVLKPGSLNKAPEDLSERKKETLKIPQPSTSPPDLPESLNQFESVASLNNESPYEIRFTVNGDEDFNPSGDFISKLLAEHVSNASLGFDGLKGYEIIRSDSPDGSDEGKDIKLTSTPNVQPTASLLTSQLTASTIPYGNQRSDQSGFPIYNSNREITAPQAIRNFATNVDSSNYNVFPRPFFLSNYPIMASQVETRPRFNDFSLNPSAFDSDTRYEGLRNSLDYSKMRVNPQDINGSLKSLFESAPTVTGSPSPQIEQILEELKKNFGEPLYNTNSQNGFIRSEGARSINHKPQQQYVNLQQYRVRTDPASGQQRPSTFQKLPRRFTTTTTTTTTTTPKPVRTVVETEFIPSLGFSFDYDEGRKQYVEAVLSGYLTGNQPADPQDDAADFNGESRQN